ncbi:hypothetical protein MFIFM68171_08743 [Madurella fahalii]|uniref:Uncharacterized protein n=1 Tax=Madurella fahalii TaxID=1157608 RepID=A0ABQ0GL79_9PEZI
MKTAVLFFITSIAAVLAAPGEQAARDDAAIAADNCFHPSSCSTTWGGKCEDYCDDRGFSHMTGEGCGWPSKKCCCIVP